MRFNSVYEREVGFYFPELDNELQLEVHREQRTNQFATLISGVFDKGRFYLEFSKKLRFLIITYVELLDDSNTKVKMYLYDNLEEALEDFKQLEQKPGARWWKTHYFENYFQYDYIDPNLDLSKMKWRKLGVLWVAQGSKGKFSIRHLHRKYIGKYEGEKITFNMPPTPTISEMKDNCEHNAYWEK